MNSTKAISLWLLVFHLIACPVCGEGSPRSAVQSLEILREVDLPESLARSWDLRWASNDSIYLAAGRGGTVQWFFEEPEEAPATTPLNRGESWKEYFTARIAVSSGRLVAAGAVRNIRWISGKGEIRQTPDDLLLDLISDVDAYGTRLVVLGGRWADSGKYLADGAFVWTGDLTKTLLKLEPIFYSSTGSGVVPFQSCGIADISVVRFLGDGSMLIIPGVEPDLFLYSSEGRLIRTWSTQELGIDAGCSLSEQQKKNIHADWEKRVSWLNKRRVVDEAIPLEGGAGIIVRNPWNGKVEWSLQHLIPDRPTQSYALPFVARSPSARIKADVRGERIVFLMLDLDEAAVFPGKIYLAKRP